MTCTAVRMNPATYGALPADACTPATTGGVGPDRITRDSHDAVGRVIQTRRGVGTAQEQIYATREYTPSGQLAWVRDAANNRTTLEYDGFDRLSRLRYPVTTVGADASSTTDLEAYAYDQASNRTRLWRRGQNPADPAQAIVYTYDALNRETVRDYPGGTSMDVYTTYDLQNRVLSARLVSTSGSGILATYDRAGRMLTEATMGRTLTYQYDAASNRTRMTWPDGLYLQTDHDPASRPTAMRENGAASGPGVLASFAYDGLSRRTGLTRGNGTVTAYSFDTAGRLSGLTQDVASTAFDQAWTMAYNPAAQIAALDGWNSAWTAPPPAVPGGSTAWAHDGLNRITGLSWDARGNLIGDGTRTFTYDLENRLLNVTSGGINVAQLLYDPQGRPYRMGPSAAPVFTLYSGPMLVAEYDAGGTLLRRHVPGPGVDEPLVTYEGAGTTDRRWLHA
ncbi:MAG: hypothetical protein Q8S53_08485, partial [Brevundimonas sp.]|nr:hypothetical protein [Brevundimonas sp.]